MLDPMNETRDFVNDIIPGILDMVGTSILPFLAVLTNPKLIETTVLEFYVSNIK